ncbi:hypothetical protein BDV18DRAFT_161084 [Aspergillus unguis]
MDESRPPKRTRQACEQCRRKKSRCPGERPSCSSCLRLGQTCEYEGDEEADHVRKMEQRIEGIEGKLEALINCFSNQSRDMMPSQMNSFPAKQSISHPVEESITPSIPTASAAQHAIQLFHIYCNFQPLPLFHYASFPGSTRDRAPELLSAMQAMGLRFRGSGIAEPGTRRQIDEWTESSRQRTMASIAEGVVELATLQTLCLLIYIDFTAGRSLKAGANFRLLLYFLQNLRFGNSELINIEEELDERLLLRWSVCLLGNLIGEPTPVIGLKPSPSAQCATTHRDIGLSNCAIQLSEVWGLSQLYSATSISSESPPPWAPESDYSRISFRHTEFESIMPLKYRLHETRFDALSGTELQRRRDFWDHWLFFQLVFHTVPCVINHPLLLSTRLRNFRHTMPQSFIQHSYEQITLHAGWVLHFIELISSKGYEVSDPTLGQCVVIVATIYLQHSFVEDLVFREKAQSGYDKCVAFLQKMALRWPNIERQVDNLSRLRRSISAGDVRDSRQTWSVNVHLLRDILIAAPPRQTAADIFGPGLAPDCSLFSNIGSPDPEFGLIGSAGISGHKTVARNLVTYFPPQQVLQPTPPDLSALLGDPGMTLDTPNNAFQPQDYGRFIDNWLDFPT